MSARILIVDDEEVVRQSCIRILGDEAYVTDTAQSGLEALRKIEESVYDLLILDIIMPRMDGLEVLQRVKESHPDIDVVMITGLSQIATAVSCMKLGALDYLPKPFDPDELKMVIERAMERRQLRQENSNLKNELSSRFRYEYIVGSSPAMRDVFHQITQCAPTNSTVLITGESGTGKELVARAIHFNSLRKNKSFVAVDCNSLSETLLESELFGHVKGSFTGAVANKKGMFEIANNGTLFLDEISNMSLSVQAKLLRVTQEREFRPVGDTHTQSTDIRLITTTNKDLKDMVAAGTFREDLYYRINIFPIQVPPLRERREDIPALAFHFLKIYSKELRKDVTEFSGDALSALSNYAWPGNVRELQNTVQRAVILANEKVIRQAHLTHIIDSQAQSGLEIPRTGDELKRIKKVVREKSVEDIEKLFLLEALKRNDWNVTRSSEETGMLRANFQALMRKYDIKIRGTESEEKKPLQDPCGT